MTTMLVLFAAMFNAGLGPFHQLGSYRPLTPVTTHGFHTPTAIPGIKCRTCV
jgi:hypothetical protein